MKFKILVVEDDEKFRTWILECLQEKGYQVFGSYDGRHALEWIQKNTIDMIITDILMPRTDGLEVLFEMKKKYPHIPAITMSEGAISFDYCLRVTQAIGAKKFLPKPFDRSVLFDAIHETREVGGIIV